MSASIGLARPSVGDDAESALRNADLALYRAKSGGRDRVAVYEPEMHASVLRRLDGAARLRKALADDRLLVAYQPIVDLRTGAVYGMETLLRFDGADLAGLVRGRGGRRRPRRAASSSPSAGGCSTPRSHSSGSGPAPGTPCAWP